MPVPPTRPRLPPQSHLDWRGESWVKQMHFSETSICREASTPHAFGVNNAIALPSRCRRRATARRHMPVQLIAAKQLEGAPRAARTTRPPSSAAAGGGRAPGFQVASSPFAAPGASFGCRSTVLIMSPQPPAGQLK